MLQKWVIDLIFKCSDKTRNLRSDDFFIKKSLIYSVVLIYAVQ